MITLKVVELAIFLISGGMEKLNVEGTDFP